MTINYMFGRLHAICLGFPTPDKKMQNGGKEEDTRKESYSHFLTETLRVFSLLEIQQAKSAKVIFINFELTASHFPTVRTVYCLVTVIVIG